MASLTPRLDRLENNKIINGNFDFWQRGTFFNSNVYTADRWLRAKTAPPAWEWTQETDVPTLAQSGFQSTYSLKLETTGSPGAVAAGEVVNTQYRLEGYDSVDLYNKEITLSFWVKSNKPGTYAVAFLNGAEDRSYVTEYTIDSASTWEKKTITITHSNVGTWAEDNSRGLTVIWDWGSGSNFQTTPDSWQAGTLTSTSNVDNILDTTGNEVYLSQVKLNVGTQESPTFARAGKNIAEELQLCQRYFEKSYDIDVAPGTSASAEGTIYVTNVDGVASSMIAPVHYQTRKRAIPTNSTYNPNTGTLNQASGAAGALSATFNSGSTNNRHDPGEQNAAVLIINVPSGSSTGFHWTADAEL